MSEVLVREVIRYITLHSCHQEGLRGIQRSTSNIFVELVDSFIHSLLIECQQVVQTAGRAELSVSDVESAYEYISGTSFTELVDFLQELPENSPLPFRVPNFPVSRFEERVTKAAVLPSSPPTQQQPPIFSEEKVGIQIPGELKITLRVNSREEPDEQISVSEYELYSHPKILKRNSDERRLLRLKMSSRKPAKSSLLLSRRLLTSKYEIVKLLLEKRAAPQDDCQEVLNTHSSMWNNPCGNSELSVAYIWKDNDRQYDFSQLLHDKLSQRRRRRKYTKRNKAVAEQAEEKERQKEAQRIALQKQEEQQQQQKQFHVAMQIEKATEVIGAGETMEDDELPDESMMSLNNRMMDENDDDDEDGENFRPNAAEIGHAMSL